MLEVAGVSRRFYSGQVTATPCSVMHQRHSRCVHTSNRAGVRSLFFNHIFLQFSFMPGTRGNCTDPCNATVLTAEDMPSLRGLGLAERWRERAMARGAAKLGSRESFDACLRSLIV